MSAKRPEYRRRRRSLLLPLLGLAAAGAVAAVVLGRHEDGGEEPSRVPSPPSPERDPSLGLLPETSAQWIAGPAGNLYVRDGGPADSSALPVLFIHSLAGNGGQWGLQLDHLHRDRRAVTLDLRGHGESDPAEDGQYDIAALAGDVAAVADQLDLRHFVLAGHSLGATVAIEYASHHPQRVAGLLLVDPNGDQSRLPREQIEPFLQAVEADPLRELEWYFRQLVVQGDPDAALWVLDDVRATDEGAIVGALTDSVRYSPLPALARYPGPRLSIVSDMNTLPYSLHKLLPDLPVELVSGTGHWLMLDRPEGFNRLLDGFLAQAERAGRAG